MKTVKILVRYRGGREGSQIIKERVSLSLLVFENHLLKDLHNLLRALQRMLI